MPDRSPPASGRLSIVVVEKDRDRAIQIVDALSAGNDYDIAVIGSETGLARQIAQRAPDIVLIDIDNPSRDTLEELTLASGPLERPVAMFVSGAAGGLAKQAIEAGVSAYVVDGLQPERLKPVLDAAIARFQMFRRMRTELAETRKALEERKVIDRAKGMLMKARGLGEEEAYALLRKAAMDQGKKVVEVAEALVTAARLLG
ncbi:ANTAR domain-containing response regulator [Pararhodobacter sp. CCB-MM2]|uniref:ANTAR domain-containing response regulator n=1 Tax=Pararhodobacter sp. CCB-MM2 TaxID=1786003 RepID=UPI00082A3653|nr:ANTAR domain-containing protein [Pararhodobacter sp. CCB-MM2]MCA2012972.1 ANTAR domain-containing protein [Cereibacter sphaeroides]